MARRGGSRHERAERRSERLDPIRWGRPRRGSLIRMIVAAVLLLTSAAVLWYQPAARAPVAPGPGPGSGQAESGMPPAHQASPEPDATAIPPGKVGVPIRLADPTALALVRPGQRVDLLRPGDRTTPVAEAALVLEVTGADDPSTGGLLLALNHEEAELAIASSTQGFAILIRPG